MADLITYEVHRPMHSDGRDYEPGDTRKLSAADAKELLDIGALSLPGEKPTSREPAVRHTFGQAEPTGHIAMTSAAGGDAVSAADQPPLAAVTTPARAQRAKSA